MSNNRLSETDPKEIDARIREYFSPEIRWTVAFQEFQGKSFGMLSVEEATSKPVVCKKSKSDVLRETTKSPLIMQRALDFLQEHNEVALATVCNNKPELRVFSLSAAKGQSVLRLRRM